MQVKKINDLCVEYENSFDIDNIFACRRMFASRDGLIKVEFRTMITERDKKDVIQFLDAMYEEIENVHTINESEYWY